jgi:hypothetical protein
VAVAYCHRCSAGLICPNCQPIKSMIGSSGSYLELEADRNRLLDACRKVVAELEERNAEEGMALNLTEKAEFLTPGFQAMLKAIRESKVRSNQS